MVPDLITSKWHFALATLLTVGLALESSQSVAETLEDQGSEQVAALPEITFFESDVLPILKANCVHCHGSETQIMEMNLATYEGVMKGSESGAVVIAGDASASRLYRMVHEGLMPPDEGTTLSEEQVATIRAWIEAGARSKLLNIGKLTAAQITEHQIIPVMLLRCTVCHGLRRQEGGLDLSNRASMLKGGKSGSAILPGNPDESLVIQKIRSGEMPPKKDFQAVGVKPVSQAEIERLVAWIGQGAPQGKLIPDVAGNEPDPLVTDKDRQFWAFQPPQPVPVPPVRHARQVRNPIDAFILSKLEEKGLTLSPEADHVTLIRRAYFDLTGLPPEPEEVQSFLANQDPAAYDKLIERLLASPRYGERWGRYWLDVAGYADSEGGKLSADPLRPYAYRYRDYVIRSFNANKPYDRFLLEQIAGDELVDSTNAPVITQAIMDNLIATGFLRMGPDSTNGREVNFVQDRLDVISDQIDIFSSAVLGLTIKCAKCHSHKYDPIPQRDYYRLAGIFKGAYDEHDWLKPLAEEDKENRPYHSHPGRYLPYITPGATPGQLIEEAKNREAHNLKLDREIGTLKDKLKEKAEPLKKRLLDQKLALLPAALHEDLRQMLATPREKRNAVQTYLAEKFEVLLRGNGEKELKEFDRQYKKEAENTDRQIQLLGARKIPEPKIRALWDRGIPSPTYVLRRGEPANFGRLVGPGVPSVLTDGRSPFVVKPPWPKANKTGRRLALARWLIQPNHPLTARVMVNRIWQHHFGAGIVKTPGNFGNTGARPTHPELLDWLALEFVGGGWSLKEMHRLMMTSGTYRQSSILTPAFEEYDPDNSLLSSMAMKRMEAEVLFDTSVWMSGLLDEARYGVPDPVQVRDDGLVTPLGTGKGWRRSIYVQQRRKHIPTILENFDLPPMSPNCLERTASNVAPQALHLMNDPMIHELAGLFADRVQRESGTSPQKQIQQAYWMALSRPPTADEKKISLEVLNRLTEEYFKYQSVTPIATQKVAVPQAETLSSPNGTGDRAKRQQKAAKAALMKFCYTLINSAGFLYID